MKRLLKPSASGFVLFLLCLMYLITYIDRVNIATAAEPIRKEFQLSDTKLGLAFSAFGHARVVQDELATLPAYRGGMTHRPRTPWRPLTLLLELPHQDGTSPRGAAASAHA